MSGLLFFFVGKTWHFWHGKPKNIREGESCTIFVSLSLPRFKILAFSQSLLLRSFPIGVVRIGFGKPFFLLSPAAPTARSSRGRTAPSPSTSGSVRWAWVWKTILDVLGWCVGALVLLGMRMLSMLGDCWRTPIHSGWQLSKEGRADREIRTFSSCKLQTLAEAFHWVTH